MKRALCVEAVGIIAPGLVGWEEAQQVLSQARGYSPTSLPSLTPDLLPANERRRAARTTRLALAVAQQAVIMSGYDPRELWSVFASSGSEAEMTDRICRALSEPDRPVSPTHFHNSVHNAPAGYWSIATQCRKPSVSLSAFDATFSAGLLEAWTTAVVEQVSVLLVAYDNPPPPPLLSVRSFPAPCAIALLLSPQQPCKPTLGVLSLTLKGTGGITQLDDPQLETLRAGNPAAQGLVLLEAFARGLPACVNLPYISGNRLTVMVTPIGPHE